MNELSPPPRQDEAIPGTVMTPGQLRKLKIAVIVMGVLLVVGFGLVLIGIVYQASKLGGAERAGRAAALQDKAQTPQQLRNIFALPAATPVYTAPFPAGAEVLSAVPAGNMFVVTVRDPGGLSVLKYDLETWQVLSLTRLRPGP